MMRVSVIIPTLNEEFGIVSCLSSIRAQRSHCEVIVVDGGSDDDTVTSSALMADRVIVANQGRARQMNAGANIAQGEILLFLHADTILPDNAIETIGRQLTDSMVWGRFDIRLSSERPIFKMIAILMNLRSRITGIATGDQAIFVKKSAFDTVGRYPEIALMEDIALSKALKKLSPPLCLNLKAVSSARRWQQHGVVKTILLMWELRIRYFFGSDPNRLARHYYQD